MPHGPISAARAVRFSNSAWTFRIMTGTLEQIEEHIPALRRYARALAGSADRADDLVQDCLERAIRKRALWRAEAGDLRAWLFTMMLNLFRNNIRQERRTGFAPLTALPDEPVQRPAQPGRLALAEVARAIDLLPAEQREVLLLVVLEGVSYAEAAKIAGIPIGTVMSRLGRARATLRAATGENGEPRLRAVK